MSYEKRVRNYPATNYQKETVEQVLKYPIANGVPERGLRKDVCEYLEIRCSLSETDGKTVTGYYFPSRDLQGKVCGFKKCDMTKQKYDDLYFSAIGKVGVGNMMFGQYQASKVARAHKTLYIVEGEWDVASAIQAMIDRVAMTKYAGLHPFVVGLNCGTKNAVENVLANEAWVKSFDEIVLGFDDDAATAAEKKKGVVKGKEATSNVAAALMCDNVFVVHYGDGMKDPSDYLQNEKSLDLAQLLSFNKVKYIAESIVKASQISFDEVMAPMEPGINVPGFPEFMRKTGGPRGGELWVVTAPSGVGKTTFISILSNAVEKSGERIANIYLEEKNKETFQRVIAAKLKVNFLKFKRDPLSVCSEEQARAVYDEIVEKDQLVMLDHFGSIPIKELMNKIKHIYYVEKCRFIFIDHLSIIVSGLESENERKDLDIAMTELAAFCASTDCFICLVSHINRTNAQQFLAPKGKEDEPYWVRVTKESLRGSAAIEQLSWVIIGLEPQIMPDRSRGYIRSVILKNRPWSYLGEADTFKMDDTTWEVVLEEVAATSF